MFDAAKISPLYTMLEVQPTDETVVKREDNFSSGDISLPGELSTTEKHYANWNKKHSDFPVDKGHSAGSQYRRGDVVEQSDIDTLAGVTPEASKTNQNVKGPLESAILAHAKKTPTPTWCKGRFGTGSNRSTANWKTVSGFRMRSSSPQCFCTRRPQDRGRS
ncbi:MAG: hypothetical protein OES47_00260 [Acidobacteriota bacterium]|nr:hypothetical protein [Acidobacteriota bacterium]